MEINITNLRSFRDDIFGDCEIENILEQSIEWIRQNCDPEDIFKKDELEYWALENGFRREE